MSMAFGLSCNVPRGGEYYRDGSHGRFPFFDVNDFLFDVENGSLRRTGKLIF